MIVGMSTLPRISDQVLVRDLEGEAVLLDLASQRYFGLDEVGLAIWKGLEQGLSREAMIRTLLDDFTVERPRLEQDLEIFLAKLSEAGLVIDAFEGGRHGQAP